jgi:recombination protein RecA
MASISISDIVEGAEKKFGKGSILRLTDKRVQKTPAIRTGIPALDLALGIGGLPKGRTVEIFGPEAAGKTTLALTVIASAQKQGAWVWYGDMEHSLDPDWAEKLGVNLDKLLISQPFCAEECLSLAEYAIGTGGIDIIVIDSVASLVPRADRKSVV